MVGETGKPLDKADEARCASLLKLGVMFKFCTPELLALLCKKMKKEVFRQGEILINQDDLTNRMFIIAEGKISRTRQIAGQLHNIETGMATVNSLHVLRREACYASAVAATEKVVAYTLDSDSFEQVLRENPDLCLQVIHSLSKEVRSMTKTMNTPLLEQRHKQSSILIVSIAASIESFYRSALNAILNARLSGVRGALFPNMHIQIPTRVFYINGVKGIRTYLDTEDPNRPDHIKVMNAIAPGLLMTPVSNILEASNAGHTNPEPIWKRSLRGTTPRAIREILFGVGINQLSDYCEERASTHISNEVLANAAGSMSAGVISGYFSHVPHNLATLKLLYPNKSYPEHFRSLVEQSRAGAFVRNSLPTEGILGSLGLFGASVATCMFPKGVMIRTTQIVGSFIVLNGFITALKNFEFLKIGRIQAPFPPP